jgi:hypothetical protein
MTLQNFTPKARIQGDKMDLRNYYGRPLLVRVNEFVPDFTSPRFPDPKPVVFVDVVDLASGQIFINALWGGGAVVDNLKEHAGTNVVLPLMAQQAQGSGNAYIALVALDDATAAAAGQWYQQNWGVVEQTRQQRMAAAQAAAPVQQQNQFQQAAQQPMQGFGGQPQQNQFQQPAPQQQQQGQFQQPMQQSPQQGFGQPQGQAPVQQGQFQQPVQGQTQQNPQQGFGQPMQQQAPQGMFSDQMPPVQQGQGFAQPQGTDPAAANAALQQLNGQLGG